MHKEEQLPNPDGWHGAQLSLTIEGNWSTYRSKIIRWERREGMPGLAGPVAAAGNGSMHRSEIIEWERGERQA